MKNVISHLHNVNAVKIIMVLYLCLVCVLNFIKEEYHFVVVEYRAKVAVVKNLERDHGKEAITVVDLSFNGEQVKVQASNSL